MRFDKAIGAVMVAALVIHAVFVLFTEPGYSSGQSMTRPKPTLDRVCDAGCTTDQDITTTADMYCVDGYFETADIGTGGNVCAFTNAGAVSCVGNITTSAGQFIGDGSALTGISSSSSLGEVLRTGNRASESIDIDTNVSTRSVQITQSNSTFLPLIDLDYTGANNAAAQVGVLDITYDSQHTSDQNYGIHVEAVGNYRGTAIVTEAVSGYSLWARTINQASPQSKQTLYVDNAAEPTSVYIYQQLAGNTNPMILGYNAGSGDLVSLFDDAGVTERFAIDNDGDVYVDGSVTIEPRGHATSAAVFQGAFTVGDDAADDGYDVNFFSDVANFKFFYDASFGSFYVGNNSFSGNAYGAASVGVNSNVSNYYSFSTGNDVDITGQSSFGAGLDNDVQAGSAVALGEYLLVTGQSSTIIGSGVSGGSKLANTVQDTLVIGYNSNEPTLVVGASGGAGTTGKVGIGLATSDTEFGNDASLIVGNSDSTSGGAISMALTATPSDPVASTTILWADVNSGDLRVLINYGGATKAATIVDYSDL